MIDATSTTFFVGIVVANISFILGSWVSMRVTVGKLEVKVDNLEGDVDNLADLLGTEKSRARAQKKGS